MRDEKIREAALLALEDYKKNKLFQLDKVQKLFDALDIGVKLEPFDKAEQAILAIVIALHLKQ